MILSRSPRVLVVDDDPNVVRILDHFLSEDGMDVITAVSGSQALALSRQVVPDMVILDVCMPRLNGYEVCSRMRSWTATRETPVLFLTGLGEDGIEDLYRVSGGNDYLTKPFSRLQVLSSVDRLLGR